MDAKVSQIIHRRREIEGHQIALKDLEANLDEAQKKELAQVEKDNPPLGSKPRPTISS